MFPHDGDISVQYIALMKDGNPIAYATIYNIEDNSFYVKGLESASYSNAKKLLKQIIDSSADSIYYMLYVHNNTLEKALLKSGFSLLHEDNSTILYRLPR